MTAARLTAVPVKDRGKERVKEKFMFKTAARDRRF